MKILIYFKQGAPTPFVNRYTHGPKEINDFEVKDGFLVIDIEDRGDVISTSTILGFEVTA